MNNIDNDNIKKLKNNNPNKLKFSQRLGILFLLLTFSLGPFIFSTGTSIVIILISLYSLRELIIEPNLWFLVCIILYFYILPFAINFSSGNPSLNLQIEGLKTSYIDLIRQREEEVNKIKKDSKYFDYYNIDLLSIKKEIHQEKEKVYNTKISSNNENSIRGFSIKSFFIVCKDVILKSISLFTIKASDLKIERQKKEIEYYKFLVKKVEEMIEILKRPDDIYKERYVKELKEQYQKELEKIEQLKQEQEKEIKQEQEKKIKQEIQESFL